MSIHLKHGKQGKLSTSSEYDSWQAAKNRCNNPDNISYEYYGGRGITMSEEWQRNFLIFFIHMGPKPTPQHSLERINNDGNYEFGNCRWATPKEQAQNRRPKKSCA